MGPYPDKNPQVSLDLYFIEESTKVSKDLSFIKQKLCEVVGNYLNKNTQVSLDLYVTE